MSHLTQPGSEAWERAIIVYVDQFAWVDLARARLGRSHSTEDGPTRDQLLEYRRAELAHFPLSKVHYLETWRQASQQRRGEVAAEMAALSGFLTLAPPEVLWPGEIDRALQARFGRPAQPRPVEPFGVGVAHALGVSPDMYPARSGLTAEHLYLAEWGILAGYSEDRFQEEERQRHETARRFAETETASSWKLKEWRTGSRDRQQRFRIQALSEFEHHIFPAFISPDSS
jgi:hypothetical protein